jgi:pantothenate kinase
VIFARESITLISPKIPAIIAHPPVNPVAVLSFVSIVKYKTERLNANTPVDQSQTRSLRVKAREVSKATSAIVKDSAVAGDILPAMSPSNASAATTNVAHQATAFIAVAGPPRVIKEITTTNVSQTSPI